MVNLTHYRNLETLESVIEHGRQIFVDVGNALTEIRDRRLYQEQGYHTFEGYCLERWGWTASRSRQLIAAAEVVNVLESVTTVTPTTESQARELVPLMRHAPEQVANVFEELRAEHGDDLMWVEAKHKTAFSWHRMTGEWCTGIDICHYEDYCKVQDAFPWAVVLLFLHDGGQAKDSPPSPSGLFGRKLSYLREHEHHRHVNWGRYGMVYWGIDALQKLADIGELL